MARKKKQELLRVIAVGSLAFDDNGALKMPEKLAPGESAIDTLVKSSVRCVLCGAGYGGCDCWVKCPTCGWMYERVLRCERCHARRRPKGAR